ncbi:AtpZ/AtpI family protein [Intestinibacillus massiliensis]|uniref:AtpZ/AtpI family protein n=1 Tax=Intestinibacillus massiliensis TaxID=1871029 RepID=UPI00135646EC|nr:AtpZ/AtpI family protein [Intestinibacillus massiliensis]MCB6364837.1 AtpZ/AtpI family protein [Intestinibacillus massiliensis]
MKNKSTWTVLKYLVYFTQFGLNMIIPPVVMTALAWWLKNKFGWGNGVIIIGILLGIAVAGCNLWKFMQYTEKKAKESEREHRP